MEAIGNILYYQYYGGSQKRIEGLVTSTPKLVIKEYIVKISKEN